ncbi:hypothetical protein [Nonomuraea sp. B19D2]
MTPDDSSSRRPASSPTRVCLVTSRMLISPPISAADEPSVQAVSPPTLAS